MGMKKRYNESLRDWLNDNRLTVIIREGMDRSNVIDVANPDTGEVIGSMYPDGYNKVHCFLDIRALGDSQNRVNVFRAAARKFLVMNYHKSYEDSIFFVKEYFRRVSVESNLSITEYEINQAVNWAEANQVNGYKDLMVRAYYTFHSHDIPINVIHKVVRHYNNYRSKVRSFNVITGSVEMQKEDEVIITQKSTANYSKEYDGKGVSQATVIRNWKYVKEDVDQYNKSTFGIDSKKDIRTNKTLQRLIEAYNNGNTTKMSLHKQTGVSRSTIDNHWNIISQ